MLSRCVVFYVTYLMKNVCFAPSTGGSLFADKKVEFTSLFSEGINKINKLQEFQFF